MDDFIKMIKNTIYTIDHYYNDQTPQEIVDEICKIINRRKEFYNYKQKYSETKIMLLCDLEESEFYFLHDMAMIYNFKFEEDKRFYRKKNVDPKRTYNY